MNKLVALHIVDFKPPILMEFREEIGPRGNKVVGIFIFDTASNECLALGGMETFAAEAMLKAIDSGISAGGSLYRHDCKVGHFEIENLGQYHAIHLDLAEVHGLIPLFDEDIAEIREVFCQPGGQLHAA